jgi:hypothetical protein
MKCEEEESREILERKIQGLCTVNEEIIQRIHAKANSNDEMKVYEYVVLSQELQSDNQPHQFKVEEIQKILPYKQIVDDWRVPASAELPVDPDSDEIMYGKNREIMSMTCQKFSDLVRINEQFVVAKRYTSMLLEPLAIKFGLIFKRNFELIHVLLGIIEEQILETESILEEKQKAIDRINEQIAQILAPPHMFSRSPYSFTGSTKEAIMPSAYQINRGTFLSKGIHRWSVKCVNVVANYDLGVASASHPIGANFANNTNPPTAWGIRQNGYLYPGGTNTNTPYNTGNILSFVLDCTAGSLSISINQRAVATIPNIILPVHIAFSGGAQARAEIL